MGKKAIHYGICQWCGSMQKLPSGVLSLHGYKVRDGWFQGVCFGAGHAPIEVSKDLIDRAIASASKKRADLIVRAMSIRAEADSGSLDCWHRVYHPELSNRSRGSVYLWEKGELEGNPHHPDFAYMQGSVRKVDQLRRYGDIKKIAAELREDYAKSLDRGAAREAKYIAWQQSRIAGWAPKPLIPIDPKARAPKADDFDEMLEKQAA